MEITVHPLSSIPASELVALLNDPDVHRHMPLGGDHWDEAKALDWARAKDAQWQANGFGPWAIRLDGIFAGWGGFQKEDADADLGLVLLPQHWGSGAAIFRELLRRGATMDLPDVTVLLPPSRRRMKGLSRLGFVPDGEVDYAGHRFLKFRLAKKV
jgi:RimJ/RimL family protein N-acetyltransferase